MNPGGARCLGCPAANIPGCGKPREPNDLDPRLRWCCTACAERASVRLQIAGPRQTRFRL